MAIKRKKKPIAIKKMTAKNLQEQFEHVAELIQFGRCRAFASVNAAVIETYWQVGQYISGKVEKAAWGQGVVQQLAEYL